MIFKIFQRDVMLNVMNRSTYFHSPDKSLDQIVIFSMSLLISESRVILLSHKTHHVERKII